METSNLDSLDDKLFGVVIQNATLFFHVGGLTEADAKAKLEEWLKAERSISGDITFLEMQEGEIGSVALDAE